MTVLALDRLPDNAPDGAVSDWSAHVVLGDGEVVTHKVAAFDRAAGTCTLSAELPSSPLAGAVCVLESAAAPSTLWRVVSVRETGGLGLAVRARRYRPDRYAKVESGLKLGTVATQDLQGSVAAPASMSLEERLYEDGAVTRSALAVGVEDPPGGRDARVTGIEYQLRRTAGEDTDYRPFALTGEGLAERLDVRPGTYRARARYVALGGAMRSPWTESEEETVPGFEPIGEPAGVTVTAVAGGYSVAWDAPPESDYAYTEILDRASGQTAAVVGRSAASPWPRLGFDTSERFVSIRHVDRAGRKTDASSEIPVTPLQADSVAAQTAAEEATASATEVREAVAGIADSVATEVDSRLDTALAPAIVLREKAGEAARLELAALSDLGGAASTARIDAGALRLGDAFEVSADGHLALAGTAGNVVPLWAGDMEVAADGAIVSVTLSADMRSSNVIEGVATAGASPYAAVPLALIVAGATAGTASARPADARKFSAVLNATASAEVYYWRSADGMTLYLQNDTAAGTPPALRLFSLVGVRNPGVVAPPN